MPLTPRYTWEESPHGLVLQLSLPGTSLKAADIYISDLVVKINAAPYVLLLDLFDRIDETATVVKRVQATHILQITLRKVEPKAWHKLTYEDTKTALKERRTASMDRKREAETELDARRKDRKYAEEKQTLRAQMAVDDANRQILSDLKAEEKAREERALYESFRELQMQQEENQKKNEAPKRVQVAAACAPVSATNREKSKTAESSTGKFKQRPRSKKSVSFAADHEPGNQQEENDGILELGVDGSFDVIAPAKKAIWGQDEAENDTSTAEEPSVDAVDNQSQVPLATSSTFGQNPHPEVSEPKMKSRDIRPPRASAQTEIRFTPRVFPTPSRESKAAEEEDWLIKNRKHLKKHQGLRGAAAAALDISESDPMWLKAKGDDFYRSCDYRSAVNAYAEALSLVSDDQEDLLITCLSNRAACLLQLAEFEDCLSDCTNALSHLPDTAAAASQEKNPNIIRNFRLKLKLLVRRGTALCRLGKFAEAKADYGVALTMDNKNQTLQHDYYQLLRLDQAEQAKLRGDESFKQSQIEDAVEHYNTSLTINSVSIACLSNRAACYLRLNEFRRCVDDCTNALDLLQQQPGGESADGHPGKIVLFATGPAPGSSKRRIWVVKTLVRRATALAAMKMLREAERDLAAAVEVDPSNTALRHDLEKLREQASLPSKGGVGEQVARPEMVAP